MRQFFKSHLHIFISLIAFLGLLATIFQSYTSKGFPNFFVFPSNIIWPRNNNINNHRNDKVDYNGGFKNNSSSTSLSYTLYGDPMDYSLAIIHNSSTLSKSEEKKKRTMKRIYDSIEEILRWRKENDEDIENVEMELGKARVLIKEAFQNSSSNTNTTSYISNLGDFDYIPHGNIYKNAFSFHRSYLLMEKLFKIYIYEEGEPPLFHYGACKNIYSMEGIFINTIEQNNQFKTSNPKKAHAFFLPFSVVMILDHLFDPVIRDKAVLERTIVDYVNVISHKYPFWNRSLGLDHFMLSCHDWGPRATWYQPLLYFHSIRALCNANTSENYNPRKDVSIPEINLVTGETTGLIGNGLPPSERDILGFFAGHMHGHIRPALLSHWKGEDNDLQIYEELPKEISYHDKMSRSKYCICPSGFEVASPRIVEAIYTGCVPVLISQNYILPYSDVLNWDEFSVRVSVSDIPNLKKILMDIPYERYVKLQMGVIQVQRHFVINNPPKRYDVFHMTIHSIWLRRLNVRLS